MYTEINKQMEEALQGNFRFNKINAMLDNLQREEEGLENRVAELHEILEKEELDVTRLENKSLTHIFYSVLGNIEEKITKEKQEALSAGLKVDQAESDLEKVRYEINKLNEEKMCYQDCARTYEKLYTKKKDLLMHTNPQIAEHLLDLTDRLNKIKNNDKEIKEAMEVGREVQKHLKKTKASLDSAHSWGTWDMLGGGLIADIAKHSHIDEAKQMAEKTQFLLRRFRTELADINIYDSIRIETDGFGKFADFFFDGLIADWSMQSKINASIDSVTKVEHQVKQVMNRLVSMQKQGETEKEKIESEIGNIVIQHN